MKTSMRVIAIGLAALTAALPVKALADESINQPDPPLETKPQIGLCPLLVGAAALAAAGYGVWKLYKCADHLLNPPPPPPPTNAPPPPPPTNAPAQHSLKSKASLTVQQPTVYIGDNSLACDTSVSANGWHDWQGNPIGYCVGGMITNLVYTNDVGTAVTLWYQTSPDLVHWTHEPLSMTAWISQAPNGTDTNAVYVVTDVMGAAISTNWCALTTYVQGGQLITASTNLACLTTIPRRAGHQSMFYKIGP
jgi:hypothetical protein